MKKNTTSLLLTGLIVCGATISCNAYANERNKRGADKGGDNKKARIEAKFNRLDSDQSGDLSFAETIAKQVTKIERRFNKLDSDQNAEINLDEFLASGRNARDLSPFAQEIVACVSAEKEDTGNEFIRVPNELDFMSPVDKFNALDSDTSLTLSLTEVTDSATERAQARFDENDSDATGAIDLDEFTHQQLSRAATRKALKDCINDIVLDDELL